MRTESRIGKISLVLRGKRIEYRLLVASTYFAHDFRSQKGGEGPFE